jgi:glutaryl-CoA dehydrogenase
MILIHVSLLFQYWEKAEFPFELVPKLAQLKVSGGTIQVYSSSISANRVG